MKQKIKGLILYVILIGFSVSIIDIFYSKLLLLLITLALGIITLIKYKRFDNSLLYVFLFFTIIQLIAMYRFSEFNSDRFLAYAQFLTRILLSYFIIKIGGRQFLRNFEKFSFILIVIGLPIFLLHNFFPASIEYLRIFDINSIDIQKQSGGWNIFIYVYNSWAGFRFSGYAYEPGGMSMMIILSLLIYILNYGIHLNWRTVIYSIALILTFSTSGFVAFSILIIFYLLNSLKSRFAFVKIGAISIALIYLIPFVWKQEFMEGKISEYALRHETVIENQGGYENTNISNVGRLSAVYVYLNDTLKWPIGHGTTINGRTKNLNEEIVTGANTIFHFLLDWGFIGFIVFLNLMLIFFNRQATHINLKFKSLLILPFLIVFSTNSMLDAPIFYIFPLYSIIYLREKRHIPPYIFGHNILSQ